MIGKRGPGINERKALEIEAIADFLFEVGMLKRTPRSGFQFLGTGKESVADHSLRCAVIGYVLANMAETARSDRIVFMCLFHDLAEARTGDLNYVNKKYVTTAEDRAIEDMTAGLPFGHQLRDLIAEFNERGTREALLANDADQLEIILQLKELADLGNPYARDWIASATKRLRTEEGLKLAERIMHTEFCGWWFKKKDDDWWVNADRELADGK
jgi:putative hydrolase of HD superfamily